MKKHLFAAVLLSSMVLPSFAAKDADPVLMTIDGKDVRVSEFEYYYNKNNAQQSQQQPLDEYLNMFIDYKLKVADAIHAGLEQKPEFQKEYARYRADASAPYLRKPEVEEQLLLEAYEHRKNDVYVSHIMLDLTAGNEAKLDSIRNLIVNGTITFEAAARAHSIDRTSAAHGGRMGYVVPDRFPWSFEKASYDTALGAISPVINSGIGYHIIRVESISPASGEVQASHILRMTQGKTEEQIARQKVVIDSLYALASTGADFADLAKRYSEDPGSARQGGSLGWFGRGMMVNEFDSVAFAIPDGAISTPFRTSFGYHIIKRDTHRGIPSLEELTPAIKGAMQRDERGHAAEEAFYQDLVAKYNASLNEAGVGMAHQLVMENDGMDSAVVVRIAELTEPAAIVNGKPVTFATVVANIAPTGDKKLGVNVLDNAIESNMRDAVLDLYRTDLAATDADYRNLLNEYYSGILLYEISNRNVWERAAQDREGLEAYFKANIDRYKWAEPKFKSYVFFSPSDSILTEAVKYAESLPQCSHEDLVNALRKQFGRDIKVERVIAAKGENPITDYLAFGGEKPAENNSKWKYYAAFKGRIIDAPEEASDVRGAAVTDYQQQLDKDWVSKLRKEYKVKVNKKELKKLQAAK